MGRTYTKIHNSDKALKSHEGKIKNRGGILDSQEFLGYGHKIKYHFPKK